MARNNPRGFVEHRHQHGTMNPITRKRRVKGNGTNANARRLFPGDPVHLVSGNTVVGFTVNASGATAASIPILGIVRAVHDNNDKPLTFSQPTNGPFLAASTNGWAYVNEDPWQTYLVSTDGSVTSTLIGQFVKTTANTTIGTAAGRSGFSISVSGGRNTAQANNPFQVIGIGANNLDGIASDENFQDVEVKIFNHVWNPPTVMASAKVR